MLVYGDPARPRDPRRVITELRTALAKPPVVPAGIERHATLVGAFIMASELAQGIADAAFEATGFDARAELQETAMAVVTTLARAVIASWRELDGGAPSPPPSSAPWRTDALAALDRLTAAELPSEVVLKVPEGYAYYALYPEAYAAAAAQVAPAPDTRVIGLRSIGTGLAAIVAAALDAPAPITLRPVGPPFQRELRLSPELRTALTAGRGRFALVDEGPGLSGSSLGCVADLLEDAGVAPERIVFFPGHGGPLGVHASARHRRRWSTVERRLIGFDALVSPERLASWAQDLIGAPTRPIEDLSGGGWRGVEGAGATAWPPANTLQERRKFKITTDRGPWLMKFVGLGALGEGAYRRARKLGEAGLSPEAVGLRHGFLVQRWIEGRRVEPCRDEVRPNGQPSPHPEADVKTQGSGRHSPPAPSERERLITHLATYLAFRARHLLAREGSGASLAALFEMARANTVEALGDRRAGTLDVWRLRLPALVADTHPVDTDNRMHAWEWIETSDGRWLKTDAVDHAHAHDLIGAQDIAWDMVGAEVELGLSAGEVETLSEAVQADCGRPISPELASFYRAAYLAFQLGAYAMAADAHQHWPHEQARLGAQRDRYTGALDRLLTHSG